AKTLPIELRLVLVHPFSDYRGRHPILFPVKAEGGTFEIIKASLHPCNVVGCMEPYIRGGRHSFLLQGCIILLIIRVRAIPLPRLDNSELNAALPHKADVGRIGGVRRVLPMGIVNSMYRHIILPHLTSW